MRGSMAPADFLAHETESFAHEREGGPGILVLWRRRVPVPPFFRKSCPHPTWFSGSFVACKTPCLGLTSQVFEDLKIYQDTLMAARKSVTKEDYKENSRFLYRMRARREMLRKPTRMQISMSSFTQNCAVCGNPGPSSPQYSAPFLGTRPNISESHGEISNRVPFCIATHPPPSIDPGRIFKRPPPDSRMRHSAC